jgi:hypothetical protein
MVTESNDNPSQPSDDTSQWLAGHLETIKRKIRDEAAAIAKADGRENKVEPRDVAKAALRYAPGEAFPAEQESRLQIPLEMQIPFSKRMALSITGVTLVSALLAIAFGVIGYLVGTRAAAQGAQFASGAFDIAKIFAGAVVGSTGATLAANTKRN